MKFFEYDYNEIKHAFAKSLKELRLHVGFSLLDLEKLTRINNPSLSRYENGKVEPSLSQAIIIAEAFQLNAEDFILFGLGIGKEDNECTTIIEYFNETIANLIFEMGQNTENLLKELYSKLNIDDIKKEFL